MADATTTSVQAAQPTQPTLPYTPSWVDRLQDWVQRLPGPAWTAYAGLGLALFALDAAAKWSDGTYPAGFVPWHLVLAFSGAYYLALMHYLDQGAGLALDHSRPALTGDEAFYETLRYRLTTLPARPTLLAGLIGAICGLIYYPLIPPELLAGLHEQSSPQAAAVVLVQWLLVWWAAGTFCYHSLHQLWWVNRIYTSYTHINLFEIGPLYVFARFAARTALGLLALMYAWIATTGAAWTRPEYLALAGTVLLVAAATFVAPLWGVHRLLSDEKTRLLGEANRVMQTATADLHRRVQSGDLSNMNVLKTALDGLVIERTMLDKISTWPWQAETARGMATALVVPVVLWLIFHILDRVLVF